MRELISAGEERLAAAGVDSPRVDAEELAAHVLGLRRGALFLVDDMTQVQARAYESLLSRRCAREPLQHLTGRAGFRYLNLEVGRGVFVPRPETEVVVGHAIDWLRNEGGPGPLISVDLCAGSGVIALSLAREVPDRDGQPIEVHAVERETSAVFWLQRNALACAAVGDPEITIHHADVAGVAAGLLSELRGRVAAVVSNPPYVPLGKAPLLDTEVRDHDPGVALFAGDDGLAVIRLVVAEAAVLLRPGGLLVVEHSDNQGPSVARLISAGREWNEVSNHQDLTGRDRFVSARRMAAEKTG